MNRLLVFLFWSLLLVGQPALAAQVQVTGKDAAGTIRNFTVTTNTDITGNLVANQVICDQVAGTTCATVTAGNALKVDGSAVTQPVSLTSTTITGTVAATQSGTWNVTNISGTVSLPTGAATAAGVATVNTTLGSPFQAGGSIGNSSFASTQSGTWNITNVSGTVSLPTGASTAAKQPALGTAGAASADVITIQGAASMTKLLVTPDSVALPANQSVNESQINGVTPLMGNGVTGTGSQRVTVASDNTAFSVNANAGTNLNTSALATSANLTAGTMKSQIVDGSGNVIASTSNNLNVQCANCSGSGVSAADAATFTAGTSLFAPIGGQFTSGGATACVTGHECTAGMTADRAVFSNIADIAGTATATGNGTTGAGSQRVTIASDNTAFSVNAASTLNAETTKVIGTVRNLGNAGAITDFAGQNAASPANAWLMGGQFQTTPTTITAGNASPLQLDNAGNLLVNIKAGAGSGGTALADKSAWTVSTTNLTPIGGEFTTGGATACATAQACAVAMTATRGLFADVNTWAETSLGAPSAYGTSPGAVNVIGVNAFVTNTNANGSATSANSSPVVIASDQVAVAIKAASASISSGAIASGAVASGAYASGSIGSGAVASGAFASGALASGSIASGAMVDLVAEQTPIAAGAATATKALAIGGQFDTTQKTLTNGQQASLAMSARGAAFVAVGADGFPVTLTSTTITGTSAVNTAQVNGVTVLTGTGATGTGAQRVTVSTDQATNAGAALVKGGVGVVNGGSFYQAVAASQTATVLQSSTGAAGDYLSHCDIYPTSTSPGVVTVFDNTNTAANSVILFAGGATSVSNLAPIPVPVGANSVSGAWKVTTGANVSVACFGKFS